jgi:mono/diheme cytochrome c family protein
MPAEVATLFGSKCSVCHGADARGGPAAPNLFAEDDKHTAAEWESYLKNTKVFNPKNRMPVVPLSDEERKTLAAWLATAVGSEAGPSARTVAARSSQEQ